MNTTKKLILYIGQCQGKTTLGEQIARLVPMGPFITMRETLTIPAVQQLRESGTGARQIIDQALQIEATGQYPEWPEDMATQLDLADFFEAVDRWVRLHYPGRMYATHWPSFGQGSQASPPLSARRRLRPHVSSTLREQGPDRPARNSKASVRTLLITEERITYDNRTHSPIIL